MESCGNFINISLDPELYEMENVNNNSTHTKG